MEPTKNLNTTTTPTSQEHKYTIQRSESYRKSNTSEYGQDTNGTKSPEDNDGVHNPAQAKPEG